MAYSTGDDPLLIYGALIAVGGFGEVHKARYASLLLWERRLITSRFPDPKITFAF
jgi:hypothetical protein